jgi:hypothetical protein
MMYEYKVRFVFDNAILYVQVLTDVQADAYGHPKDEDAVVEAAQKQFEREVGLVIPLGKPCLEVDFELTDIVNEEERVSCEICSKEIWDVDALPLHYGQTVQQVCGQCYDLHIDEDGRRIPQDE